MLVTVDLDEEGQPVEGALAPDGSTQALSTTSIRVRFNRFLLPTSVSRQAVCVQSRLEPVATFADCADPVFLEPTYDPTRREVIYRQSLDQPRLVPGTKYQITVLPTPAEGASTSVRAFDGAPLAGAVSFQFTTMATDPSGAKLETLPTNDLFCSPKDCMDRCTASKAVTTCQAGCATSCTAECSMCAPMDAACQEACDACTSTCKDDCLADCTNACPRGVRASLQLCAFGGCHLDRRDENGIITLGAASGLDLGSPEAIAATAINRVARQTQMGEHADEPDRTPLRFGRAMPLLDSGTQGTPGGNPGNSYLLYKLVVARNLIGEATASPEELARLHGSVIVGMPMPPPPGQALRDIDLTAISTWIAQGTPTPACE